MKVKIERKYWPANAKGDNDALNPGDVVDLKAEEAKRVVELGIASIVFDDKDEKKDA